MNTMSTTSTPTVERITCDDVKVGDRIARSKTHQFQEVVHITEGPAARRLFFSYTQTSRMPGSRSRRPGKWWGINIRPQRHTKLWREVSAPAAEEAPRYRVDVSLTIDTWEPSPTDVEVADAVRQHVEGPIDCPTMLADTTVVTKEFTPDAVEAAARRID